MKDKIFNYRAYTKLNGERFTITLRPSDYAEAIRNCLDILKTTAQKKEQKSRVVYYGEDVETYIDGLEGYPMSDHLLYETWIKMNSRCHNPNDSDYYLYGATGINVYHEWRRRDMIRQRAPQRGEWRKWNPGFVSFVYYIHYNMGMKPEGGYTLDRIYSSEGYYPGNIRWATWEEQNNPYRKRIRSLIP